MLNGVDGDGDSPHWLSPSGTSALLEQIRGGAQLKKVEQNQRVVAGGEGREALLGQIRQGVQLKPVSRSACWRPVHNQNPLVSADQVSPEPSQSPAELVWT